MHAAPENQKTLYSVALLSRGVRSLHPLGTPLRWLEYAAGRQERVTARGRVLQGRQTLRKHSHKHTDTVGTPPAAESHYNGGSETAL